MPRSSYDFSNDHRQALLCLCRIVILKEHGKRNRPTLFYGNEVIPVFLQKLLWETVPLGRAGSGGEHGGNRKERNYVEGDGWPMWVESGHV